MNNIGQNTTASTVQPAKPAGRKNTVLIVIIGVVVIIVGLIVGHRIFKNTNVSPTPEPTDTGVSTDAVENPSPIPVDKSNVSILIENGTGIPGEAAYLEGILKNDNYSDISVKDADSTDNTNASVSYSSTLDQTVSAEITGKLNGIYQTVDTSTSSNQTQDIVIITGLRTGQTPLPVATSTPVPAVTPTPTATPAPTPDCSTNTSPTSTSPDSGQSNISGGPGTADGSSQITITITLKDSNGNFVQGATVNPQNANGITFSNYGSNVTNNCGQAAFYATSSNSGSYSIQVNGTLGNSSTFSITPSGTLTFN